jgi:DNA (cytosine-5)-methyltransferase 1
MKYLSVCSGIEAATCAWHPLGWRPFAFSEIEPFPSAVLAHHYPDTPNLGDMTQYRSWPDADVDVLVGGTPCQSFSVAGLRKGLDDPRGNLMLTFGSIAAKYRPAWLVWENVPGVLSSNGGRDFGTFLGMLGQLGYGFAYRVLDAQYFGVAQRRRRVFVVGHLGDWRRAAAVLFERHSLSGDTAPSREAGEEFTQPVAECLRAGGNSTGGDRPPGTDADTAGTYLLPVAQPFNVANCLTARTAKGMNSTLDDGQTPIISHAAATTQYGDIAASLTARHDSSPCADRGQNIVAFHPTQDPISNDDGSTHALGCGSSGGAASVAVAFQSSQSGVRLDDVHATLDSNNGSRRHNGTLTPDMQVRRLAPRECERLQGFRDEYTAIPWRNKAANECPDGPRYKALGNSMAVPVMAWIGRRIQEVETL